MANSKNSSPNAYEYATIDTLPGAAGYWTNPVSIRRGNSFLGDIPNLYFSVREGVEDGATANIPTLQFKCAGDPQWTDYNTTDAFVVGDRLKIESNAAHVQWRAGVKAADFTVGDSIIVGFDW